MAFIKNDVLPALAIGFIQEEDIKILSIDKDVIVFEKPDLIANSPFAIKVAMFCFKSYDYEEFTLEDCKVTSEKKENFSFIYECRIGRIAGESSQRYFQLVNEIKRLNLILDQTDDIAQIHNQLKDMIGEFSTYPFEEDNEFKGNIVEQEKEWFSFETSASENYKDFANAISPVECCFFINNYRLYDQYLCSNSTVSFTESILERLSIKGHGLFYKQFSRLYIGNEYCANLFPTDSLLFNMLNKAFSEGYQVTIAFSVLVESALESCKSTLNKINNFCEERNIQIEIVINDWGILQILSSGHFDRLIPILGRLQNKRKKDSRFEYWYGQQQFREDLGRNNLNSNHLIDFLNSFGIQRFEFESTPSECDIPKGEHTLHFPYYQVNTSRYCRLKSECSDYLSNKAEPSVGCPRYCSEFGYLYPAHLNLSGRGNSILGFDKTIFTDYKKIDGYIKKGIDRIVFSAE